LDQLLNQRISTFLIKGNPGVGKSTLALELLSRMGKGTYVSTRVPTEKVLFQNPRMRTLVLGKNVEQFPGEKRSDTGRWGTELHPEDYRLAGAEMIMQLLFETVADKDRGMIVLDSWDSIAKELDLVERLRTEKTMVAAVQSTPWSLAFVSEEPSMTSTDYLVDAVVELHAEMRNNYVMRKMGVTKLRGQPIGRPGHVFSLDGGVFKLCEPTRIIFAGQYKPVRYVSVLNQGGLLSSGMPEMDSFLGPWFRPGAVIALEFCNNTPMASFVPAIEVLWANILENGGCIAALPPAGLQPGATTAPLRAMIPNERVETGLRAGYYEHHDESVFFKLDGRSLESTMETLERTIEQLKRPTKRHCLVMVGIDKLEYVHNEEEIPRQLVLLVDKAKAQGDTVMFGLTDVCASRKTVESLSDVQLLFELMEGVLTIQPVNPNGPPAAVHYDYSHGYPQVSLVPLS
jgi:KaiC/GvpD/RAD55 family RecA-like ATPase